MTTEAFSVVSRNSAATKNSGRFEPSTRMRPSHGRVQKKGRTSREASLAGFRVEADRRTAIDRITRHRGATETASTASSGASSRVDIHQDRRSRAGFAKIGQEHARVCFSRSNNKATGDMTSLSRPARRAAETCRDTSKAMGESSPH